MKTNIGRVKKTSRGFAYIPFKDANGDDCSIQVSSLVTPHLWLGCEHETIDPLTLEFCGARMHLNRKLARTIVKKLNKWLETGRI